MGTPRWSLLVFTVEHSALRYHTNTIYHYSILGAGTFGPMHISVSGKRSGLPRARHPGPLTEAAALNSGPA